MCPVSNWYSLYLALQFGPATVMANPLKSELIQYGCHLGIVYPSDVFNYHVLCWYMQMWANSANNNNRRVHLAFPTSSWTAINSNVTSSVAPVPNFPSKWNASIVSKYLKVEPSNPWRRSYFVWQPLILLFTSLSVPLCLVEPPLCPLVTVLWVIPSALGCLSNIQDSEGQSGARSLYLPHRLSPSNDQHYMPDVNYFPVMEDWFKNFLSCCRYLLVVQGWGQATSC